MASVDVNVHGVVAYIADYESSVGLDIDLKVTIEISGGAVGSTLLHDRCADQRVAVLINYRTAHGDFLS